MKRSPLNRGSKPLKRTELKRGTSKLATSNGPARRSKARTKQMKDDRIPYIESLVAAGVGCEISMVLAECPHLADEGITLHCTGAIQGMHERRKSGTGGSRINRANLVPACNWCNGFLEDAHGLTREWIDHESGLVVREGNPEWEQLSKRRDKEVDADPEV